MGAGSWGLGFGVWGLGVGGLGFEVWGLGFSGSLLPEVKAARCFFAYLHKLRSFVLDSKRFRAFPFSPTFLNGLVSDLWFQDQVT